MVSLTIGVVLLVILIIYRQIWIANPFRALGVFQELLYVFTYAMPRAAYRAIRMWLWKRKKHLGCLHHACDGQLVGRKNLTCNKCGRRWRKYKTGFMPIK